MKSPRLSTPYASPRVVSKDLNLALISAAWIYVFLWLIVAVGRTGRISSVLVWTMGFGTVLGIVGAASDVLRNQRHRNVIYLYFLTIGHALCTSYAIWVASVTPVMNSKILVLLLCILGFSPVIYTQGRQLILVGVFKPQTSTTKHLMYAWWSYVAIFVAMFLLGFYR